MINFKNIFKNEFDKSENTLCWKKLGSKYFSKRFSNSTDDGFQITSYVKESSALGSMLFLLSVTMFTSTI